MIPFTSALLKPALIDYDETAIADLGCLRFGARPSHLAQEEISGENGTMEKTLQYNLSRPELFGFVAFVIVVMGMCWAGG